jgi:glutaredoxin
VEKVVLYRCPITFLRFEGHGCHAVQKALEERGIEYELRTAPMRKSRRPEVQSATGQTMVPAIVFADGSGYRDEGKTMAAEIRAGRLFEHRGDVPG